MLRKAALQLPNLLLREGHGVFGYAVPEILGKLEAEGTETMVRITIAERDGTFSVELQHNGRIKPMEDAEGAEALSVLGMKMRALRLKGTLHIRCDPDCCTVIRIETPLGMAQR